MDFANKYLGGGVLRTGCVQEEIMFLIKPELFVTCLVVECLNANEAIIVEGAEQYSTYKGYGETFEWFGDFNQINDSMCNR